MIDLSNVTAIALGSDDVLEIQDAIGTVLWQKIQPVLPNYFYVEDISGADNTLSIVKSNEGRPTIEVFKSTDQVNWESMGSTSTTPITTTIPANGKLYLKAETSLWGIAGNANEGNIIQCSGGFNVGGNIMSLLNGDNFSGTVFTNTNNGAFNSLFRYANTLVSASDLILPSNVVDYCYQSMFSYCSSFTTAPTLPATTLTQYCYFAMFERSATNTVITYANNISASNSTDWWLENASATGDFYNLGSATYESNTSGIPSGWTEHNSL